MNTFLYKLFFFFLISFLILLIINSLSFKLKMLDMPNYRKLHKNPVPYTGGLALSIIYIISIKFFSYNDINLNNNELNLIISQSTIMMFVGLIDDKYNLNVGGKLGLQLLPIFYLVVFSNLYLADLGTYGFFKTELGSFAVIFTIGCVFLMINSTNYFDGLDGSLVLTFLSSMLILFYLTYENEYYKIFIICLTTPLFVFLFFNFSVLGLPKMFLGDSGSLMLGFILSFFLILLSTKNVVHPIVLAWTVSIFVYEFLAVNLIRIFNDKKLFRAGNDHLHYFILKKSNSKFLTNFAMITLNLSFFLIGYLSFQYFSSFISLVCFILFFTIYLVFRLRLNGMKKKIKN